MKDLLTSEPPLHKEAWYHMKGWYNFAASRVSLPVQLNIERITAERVTLHHHIPPMGDNIPIYVDPFLLDGLVPMEVNIKWAVRRLRDKRSGGPS